METGNCLGFFFQSFLENIVRSILKYSFPDLGFMFVAFLGEADDMLGVGIMVEMEEMEVPGPNCRA
jgi:hypothetical protein